MDERGGPPNEHSLLTVLPPPPALCMPQDCLKAMSHPSLLGSGSREFQSFIRHIRPEFESQVLYLDVLIGDCQEAAAVSSGYEARVGPLSILQILLASWLTSIAVHQPH